MALTDADVQKQVSLTCKSSRVDMEMLSFSDFIVFADVITWGRQHNEKQNKHWRS